MSKLRISSTFAKAQFWWSSTLSSMWPHQIVVIDECAERHTGAFWVLSAILKIADEITSKKKKEELKNLFRVSASVKCSWLRGTTQLPAAPSLPFVVGSDEAKPINNNNVHIHHLLCISCCTELKEEVMHHSQQFGVWSMILCCTKMETWQRRPCQKW